MDFALLPFPTYRKSPSQRGLPDVRHALASRERCVAPTAIDNTRLLDCVVDALRELPWEFAVDHCREEEGRLHLAVVALNLGRDLNAGLDDRLSAGFYLHNDERQATETLVCARTFRVACSNGALLECDEKQSFALAPHKAAPTDWPAKIRCVVQRSFSGDAFDLDLGRFRATTTQLITTPYEFLCHLAAQGLIDDDEQSAVQHAFDEAADYSMYGLINAVTFVAHRLRENDDWTRAFHFERLGGEILRGDHNLPQYAPTYA